MRPGVKTEDYWEFKFEYIENVKLTLDAEGITIPYPTMDVNVAQAA